MDADRETIRKGSVAAMKTIRNMMKKMGKGSIALMLAVLFVLLAGVACASEKAEMASTTIKVVWDDDDNAAGKRPSYVYVGFTNDPIGIGSIYANTYLRDSNNWTATSTSTSIPAYDPETGEKNTYEPFIEYRNYPNGYVLTREYDEATNTHTWTFTYQQYFDLEMRVWFDDMNDAFGRRPADGFDAFKIGMYGRFGNSNRSEVKAADERILNNDGSMTLIWHNAWASSYSNYQPQLIEGDKQYWLENDYCDTLTCFGAALRLRTKGFGGEYNFRPFTSNTSTAAKYGTPIPDSFTIRLVDADGNTVVYGNDQDDPLCEYTFETFPLNGGYGNPPRKWVNHYFYLPLLDENGETIDYSGYHVEYVDLPPYVLYENARDIYIPGLIAQIKVNFSDKSNVFGTRPSSVTVEYREKNNRMQPVTVTVPFKLTSTENSGISGVILPQITPEGEILEWEIFVEPEGGQLYDREIKADLSLVKQGGSHYSYNRYHTITYTLKTTKVRTQVIWDDENDAKNTRPDDVVVTVMTPVLDADGNKVTNEDGSLKLKPVWEGASAVLNESNGWAAVWDVPPCDAEGNELEYYVQQGQLPVHVTTYHDPETDADGARLLKITNVPLDAWNYAIDLRWETNVAKERYHRYEIDATDNATRTLKYELTVNTSTVDYNPGMMEVRMPYYLCETNTGKWVAPSQVSVPKQPEHNDVYSFHYYIDDHGTEDKSDDEIVYVNWKEMEAGTNQTLTVIYKITPFEMIDTKVWELTATGYARNEYQEDEQLFEPEVKQSATISYGIDTGAQLTHFVKAPSTYYYGGLESDLPDNGGKPMYYYDTTYFDSNLYPKENFDPTKYHYVGYLLQVHHSAYNQPFHFHFEDHPEDGGEVVSVKYRSSNYSVGGIENLAEDLTSWDSRTVTSCNGRWSSYSSYYVVVAWPIDPDAEDDDELVYENNATVTMIADVPHEDDKGPNDHYDLSSLPARAYTTWEDYEFSYTGNIYSQYKGIQTNFESGGFTLNKYGKNTNVSFYTTTSVSGFNLNGYKFNMTDHDLYLRAYYKDQTYSDFVRISEGDYHLAYLRVSLKAYEYDRSTGEQIVNTSVEGKPFKVQGQIGKYGEWMDIGEFVVTENNQYAVMNYTNGYSSSYSIGDKGYTGFRILAPEGLEGYTQLRTEFRVALHADSPRLAPFFEEYDDIQYMYLHNFSTLWLDVLNDEGEYYWFNPIESYEETSNEVLTGLTEDDMTDYGALPEHDEAYSYETKVGPDSPSRTKTTLSQTNDIVNGMVRGRFRLQAGEYQYSTQLPTAYYEAMSIDDGIFYDLLPAGWIFDETQPIRAYGSSDSTSYTASCTYEIIDDFKGTGRQMVIFKVKSERAAGKNYYSSNRVDTCLNVEYSANITWNELRYHRNGYNLMAFQEGDGTRPGREFYASGSYGADQFYDDGLPDESSIADKFKLAVGEDGNYAFYDINNDGVTDRNDTLMYYSTVSPEVAMTVETGIYKLVKGDSGLWKKHDTTHTDGTYRYKLGVTTSDGGDTSNLVIYDVLEDATNVEGFSGERGWKGTFVGLDLRLPKSQGIAPVVYYSTTPGLIFANENTDMNIKDESIWSTTPPADLSTVTAIAVDLTTRVDGEPFVFEGQGTTEFEIIMKAPSEVPEVRLAYNRLAYSSDFLTYGNVEAQHKYNIGKRVTIELRDLQDIQFYKLGEMDTIGENADGVAPIGGLKFELFKCSHVCNEDCADGCVHTHSTGISSSACWTNTPFRTVYSESDGLVNFVRLDTGSYAVREPSARTGYQSISNVLYVFDVDASNSTVTGPVRIGGSDENDLYAENGKLYLKNIRQKKTIYLYKNWQSEVSGYVYRPEKITVDLYRNGELYMEDLELTKDDRYNNTTWRLMLEDLMLYDPYGNYYTYTFTEEPVDGYVLSSQSNPNSNSSANAYLYNRQQGALQIGKTVVDGDEDKLFTFKVQLGKDSNDEWPTGTVVLQRWAGDEMVARSEADISDTGVITAQCKHGEIVRVLGLPVGITYSVTEENEAGYTQQVSSGSVSGTLASNTLSKVEFTNTYDATGKLPLSAVKTVNGQTPAADESFTFTLTSGAGTPAVSQEKTSGADGSITFDAIEYDLSDAGNTYTYTVQETSQSGDGYTMDDTVYTITAVITDNGDGTLSVETEISNGAETVEEITFDNTYEATGEVTFTAEKTVNGEEPRADQVFDFTLSDGEGNGIETVQNDGGEIAFETITYDLDDVVGSPYTYTVEETSTDGSGYTVDTTLYTVTVELEDNRDGTLKVTKTVTEGVDEVQAMTFANTYEATGEVTFTAEKTVNGEEPRADQVFDFTLSDGEGNEIETVQNDGGEIAFETITYDLDDVAGSPYTYTVEETSTDGSGYTVDTTVYTVTVELEDNRDGTLKVIQTITDETGEVQAMTFANTYEATGEVTLTAEKTVNGDVPREDQVFDFALTDGAGYVIDVVHNDGSQIAFETINYHLADVAGSPYTYRVEEISESGDGYTVDTTLYTVTVALEDNRDGTLKVTATYADGGENVTGMTFDNIYEATGQLPLSAVKTVNGGEPRADQVFDFRLTGANQTVLQTVSNNGSQIDFETLTYDLDDVAGSPYTYTVTETGTDGNGYTLDTSVYTLFVWLEDNRDGTLNVTSLIKKAGETVDNIIFDNTYEAEGQFTPVAVKTVNGGEPRADQVYTFNLYSADAETPAVNQTAENTGSSVTFQPLSFTLFDAGHTYTYQVEELSVSLGHKVMDETVYTLTLQIEDGRDGTLVITPSYAIGGESAEEIIFRNMVYAPLTIRKEITGPETEETFPFTIRLYNADGTESTEAFAYTGAKEGILHSGDVILLGQDESITIPYLLPGMSYAVEEEAGIRYTGTVNGQPAEQFAGTCTEGGDLVTFTNVLKTTAIAVVKEWQGGIGGDIQLTLYANGIKVEPQPAYHQDGQTYSYINLPMYDSLGQLITYSVKEKYMDGYLTIYQNAAPHASETDCVYNGGTIINREVITFRIRKVWSGLGDEPAPPIKLTLYCNGVVYDRDQPTPDEDGWYVYRNLPKYVNGERAQYTIKETAMSGYETYYYAIDGSRAEIGYNGGKINNVKLPDTGDRSHPEWWIALAALAVCALGVLVIRSRRRR